MRYYHWFLLWTLFFIIAFFLIKFFGKNFSSIKSMIFPSMAISLGMLMLIWVLYFVFSSTFKSINSNTQKGNEILSFYLKDLSSKGQLETPINQFGILHIKGEVDGVNFTMDFNTSAKEGRRLLKTFSLNLVAFHIKKARKGKIDLQSLQNKTNALFPNNRITIQQSQTKIYSGLIQFELVDRNEEIIIESEKFTEWFLDLIDKAK